MKALVTLIALAAAPAWAAEPVSLDSLAGNWVIHDPAGTIVGRSRIEVQAPGSMIFEQRVIGDEPAQQLWFSNSERAGGWIQLFVAPGPRIREFVPLQQSPEWPLLLGADVRLRDGTPVKFRMTMSRESDSTGRRILEMSRDDGATWSTVFDYTYRREAGANLVTRGRPATTGW